TLALADAPGSPALSATAGDTTVDLAWTAPDPGTSPISAYRVYRGTTSGGESLIAELGDVHAYQETGLTDGTTYYYEVAAGNGSDPHRFLAGRRRRWQRDLDQRDGPLGERLRNVGPLRDAGGERAVGRRHDPRGHEPEPGRLGQGHGDHGVRLGHGHLRL